MNDNKCIVKKCPACGAPYPVKDDIPACPVCGCDLRSERSMVASARSEQRKKTFEIPGKLS